MARRGRVVFLVDVDNTLLDNDAVEKELKRHLARDVGRLGRSRYWRIFERLRAQLGYADYLGAIQRYRQTHPRDLSVIAVSAFLIDYPFGKRLFPGALQVLRRLRRLGRVAILTDGDVVFQPHKIERAGIGKAVNGRILIYIHKEQELRDIEKRLPADHYVLIDDKPRILGAVKKKWKDRVTTVFVRQGHYARDRAMVRKFPPADVTVARIGELLRYRFGSPVSGSSKSGAASAR